MSTRPIVIPDTTVINKLAEDKEMAFPLIAGLKSSYLVRLSATNIDEIIATSDAGKRARLLDICRDLLTADNAEIIRPFHDIIEKLIIAFERGGSFDWKRIPVRLPEYEREVVLRERTNDSISRDQREQAGAMKAAFENLCCSARPGYEEIFKSGLGPRPCSAAELVSMHQVEGGALWGLGANFYGHITKRAPSEENIRKFTELCPPFRALLIAYFVSFYELSVRVPETPGPVPHRNDMLMSVYLPYCDEFVSDDRDQQTCLGAVASLAGLTARIRWFREFRDSFVLGPPG